MENEELTTDRSDVVHVLRELDSLPVRDDSLLRAWTIESVSTGFNEVYLVTPRHSRRPKFVVKFGTYSTRAHFRAGIAAYRLLEAYTDLPVPTLYGAKLNDETRPPAIVMEFLPGEELAEGFLDTARVTDLDAVRLLGEVIGASATIPDHAAEGYGYIRSHEQRQGGPCAVGKYDNCRSWFLDYASQLYSDPPSHEGIQSVVPDVRAYLRANADRLPATPAQSVVITDFSPQNLLSHDGTPPDHLDGLTGVIDLERAKLAPAEFAAVNVEYLLTRFTPDTSAVTEALYDPLPFSAEMPGRDLYRLIAMGRSVVGLPFWYEPGSETYQERGTAIAAEITEILD
ncbi:MULTISPECIES: phosphotransferase family protein [Haloferax]|uniref:Phosphotransferase n=1 Tax=Haloferax marinum TaxID=2666143 RepID=A0A6A8G7Z0_9EURY|nr:MULTISPECIES: phosphotransferase [Haloferax]KAB1197922.1 phosphotransferase [Haloferax sp. CBA1150]MRW96987.1 phosphotransferase [Haloferax marinum]